MIDYYLLIIIHIIWCISDTLPENLLHAADNNEHRDPQMANTQRIRDHSVLIPNLDMYIIFLIPRIRDHCGRQGREIIRAWGSGDLEEIVFSRYIGTAVHMNSQWPWQNNQDLYKLKIYKSWAWLWGGGHDIPPLPEELLAFDTWLGEGE